MKEQKFTKKQKITFVAIFAMIVAILAIAASVLNHRATTEGLKTFQVEVVSERDDYAKTVECASQEEYLGAYIRTFPGCRWEELDYGIYITGFDDMMEDISSQYWWCVMVDGEAATVGADEIPLEEGKTYNFVLMQGW